MKIKKYKNRYRARVRVQDGKYKDVYGKTKTEVKQKAKAIEESIIKGSYIKRSAITFREYVELYIKDYCSHLSASTLRQYRFDFSNHLLPALGERQMQKITRRDVQELINSLDLKPKTIRNIYGILSKVFSEALRDGILTSNPCEYVRLPKRELTERKPLDISQVRLLLEYVKDGRYQMIIEFLLLTGLRISELIGLLPDAVDTISQTITVKRQISRDGQAFSSPKHGRIRTVVLPDRASQILEYYLTLGGDFVFIQLEGKGKGNRINPRALNAYLKKAGEAIGYPGLSAHVLRHTYATLLLEAGVSPKVIQKSLGHHTSDFTLQTYTHATESGYEALRGTLDKLFS